VIKRRTNNWFDAGLFHADIQEPGHFSCQPGVWCATRTVFDQSRCATVIATGADK
jgi:hypothetical protein